MPINLAVEQHVVQRFPPRATVVARFALAWGLDEQHGSSDNYLRSPSEPDDPPENAIKLQTVSM
jgi:hypothetical protein